MHNFYQAKVAGFESACYSCKQACIKDLVQQIAKAQGINLHEVLMVDIEFKAWSL